MRAQQVPQPTHRSTAAARYAPSLQPCRVHAGPRAALPSARASQQLEQQQPCSSDSLSHSSSRAELGQGDPLPQLGQQQQQRQCVQQPLLSSQLPLLTVVSAHQLWTMLHSLPAHAAETIPPEAVVLFREFLDQIAALGPWGGALFVMTVMLAEMVPLFPTQPLTLASGLLFGPVKGAVFVVIGVTLAAINAYSLSRGVGKQLAQKVIASEMNGEESGGPVAKQLAAVTAAIEAGGFMRQVTAITLLRLTPVVPFSASNYLLGLTPVELGPLVIGTVAGMSVWSILYASLGGASKALLESGADLDVLLADLGEKAGQYSSDVAVLGLAVGGLLGAGYLITQRAQRQDSIGGSSLPQPEVPPLKAPREEALQGQQK